MAFGISKKELRQWKAKIDQGEIAFITHYWIDDRFPGLKTVTKVGCENLKRLEEWGAKHGLKPEWIHIRKDGYSHYDLIGPRQKEILKAEGLDHLIW